MKTSVETALKSETLKMLGSNIVGVMIALTGIQLTALVVSFMMKESIMFVHLTTFVTSLIAFTVLKDHAGEKEKEFGASLLKASILIAVMAIVSHFFLSGLNKVGNEELRSSITTVMMLVNIFLFVSSFGLWRQESVKEMFETYLSTKLLDLFETETVVQDGDAVIGKDIDDKKPIVVPLKDRYLHMLVLGPTGSGKTSQTIIPMINKDMQVPEIGITVIEPKGDLAEKIWAMAKHYGREVQYFNPILPDCPYFNPLYGDEGDVIENMAMTFKMLNPDSPQFFLDMNENLVRKSLKVLKRLYGNDATLLQLDSLIHNTGGAGEKMVMEFSRVSSPNETIQKENSDIALWFMQDYFTGAKGTKTATKTYEHCSGIRSQVAKLTSNEYLRRVLNPPPGRGSDVDFDAALENGTVITIATAQGKLRELGRFLGFFIILQLQSAVFRRPGNEFTRKGNMLYIDEFQVYANPGFEDMLTQGRSYRVASHLATQSRALIGRGGQSGKDFLEVVSTNCRNVVVYPGGSNADDQYFEKYFGEIEETRIDKGISRKKFSLFHSGGAKTETSREVKEKKARFSATEIHFRPFGQVTHALMKNNSVQPPGVSLIEYIPKELNQLLDEMVMEYNEEQAERREKMLQLAGFGTPVPVPAKNIPTFEDEHMSVQDPLSGEQYDVFTPPVTPPTPKPKRQESDGIFFEEGEDVPKKANAPVADETTYNHPGASTIGQPDIFFNEDNDVL
ncbi:MULTISPECIES: type IV secretory system conjugative DNA transfer family protein [unclassified Exiguobacterium]|uniref:type IV secretory system conjugative DNA transfer family protein n=1 Tax=unclassified Exiguobacterium TaxID=2644629 RepID=UPI001BEAD9B4|nr:MULTISPECIES: type IV secretory system conjugative DNA transfer family protein [unclassified Exiguobacterium]